MKKTRFPDDPFAERELERYEHPVPSREYIMEYLSQQKRLVSKETLYADLKLKNALDEQAIQRRLLAMQRAGQIVCDRRGRYGIADKMDLICGTVIAHRDGYGFIHPEQGGTDLFLPPREMRKVFHGDRVMVRVIYREDKDQLEANIAEILDRELTEVVGRFCREGSWAYVVPFNKFIYQDIVIPEAHIGQAKEGDIVKVDLLFAQAQSRSTIGKIIEILGRHNDPGLEIDIAIHSYQLPHEWPQALVESLAQIDDYISENKLKGREDYRDKYFVTIDGEDAKDFDDAVYCEVLAKGRWCLYVAIADVSAYVQPGTPLDTEAKARGTSVYFPERVVPMLPEVLSNGLCSLMPNQDRLSLVCKMVIDQNGMLEKSEFLEAVICSKARLTYTEVAALITGDDGQLLQQHSEFLPFLYPLLEVYEALSKQRKARGAIDFETVENRIIFGDNKKIEKVVPVYRNVAHRIIEECMLVANVAAARLLLKRKIPMLYRVHAPPRQEKIHDVHQFIQEFGLQLGGDENPRPADYAKLITEIKTRDEFYLIQTVLLRSLNQAVYSPDNIGHFGLSYPEYTHFTSPIRRYPDLLVHRAIRSSLHKGSKSSYSHEEMVALGEHCSMTERRADEATRDVVYWLKCEYMQHKIGEQFQGMVTGVVSFGLFIELDDIFVNGLLHVTELENDYYHFDATKHTLTGEYTRESYRLGDKIKVRVIRVDLDERKIDFDLVAVVAKAQKTNAKTTPKKSRKKLAKKTIPKKTKRSARKKKNDG